MIYLNIELSKEERNAIIEAVKAKAENFRSELQALLAKYKCEMTILTGSGYGGEYVKGIEISFDAVYDESEIVDPYFDMNIGSCVDGSRVEIRDLES